MIFDREEAVTVAKTKETSATRSTRRSRPALTPEARESQMIALAMDLAEEQLRNGTATSQVITHYLKLGSSKEKLEQQILAEQKEYLEAKTQAIHAAQQVEELYRDALDAMREYSGHQTADD